MRPFTRSALAALALSSFAQAQYLINELSFGHGGKISPEENGLIPGFHLQGQPDLPQLLSNRIILTPIAPGNERGAVWGDNPLQHTTWVADVDFRASGPERGGGNLNIWLVNGGPSYVAAGSIYTIGRFEGFALVVDTHGGTGGMIRGFLNDGSVDYSTKQNIDELAFGHCFYAYRNLGRPSQIKMRQEANNFKVEIDGRLCFESSQIQIPKGYKFGITAATPDNPDSFEIFKLVVMAESLDPSISGGGGGSNVNQQAQQAQDKPGEKSDEGGFFAGGSGGSSDGSGSGSAQQQQVLGGDATPDDPFDGTIPDQAPEMYTSSRSQFADLHNRLQSVNHHISTIYRSVAKFGSLGEKRHEELSRLLSDMRREIREVRDMRATVDSIEKEVRDMRREMNTKLRASETNLKSFLSTHHATLSDNIVKATPGHGKLIMVIVGGQILLVLGFLAYKKRKNSMPKKYL